MKKLYYFPLEQYAERYTSLMSCKDGWAESKFKDEHIDFIRVDGHQLSQTIKNGSVLDATGRCYYAMSQLNNFIEKYFDNLSDNDVVYVEDFWHPGIESLFYIRHLCNKKFKIGCFCHAQSVDDSDFTWVMKDWMRPIEQGFGRQYDFVFTCSHILKTLLIDNNVTREDNTFVVGLPFNSTCLTTQLKAMGYMNSQKENYVIFSSRFDDEKDPMFFLDLVEECPEIQFKLVSPYTTRPISKNPEVLHRLNKLITLPDSNLSLISTQDKVKYYDALSKAKVQFNCAIQDWVSWTLIEASYMKCYPLYPKWKDFPYELNYNEAFLYNRRDLQDAAQKLRHLMTTDIQLDTQFIVNKHDRSWNTYLKIMELV